MNSYSDECNRDEDWLEEKVPAVFCCDCDFYHQIDIEKGSCRFNPPPWQTVKHNDWCGKLRSYSINYWNGLEPKQKD